MCVFVHFIIQPTYPQLSECVCFPAVLQIMLAQSRAQAQRAQWETEKKKRWREGGTGQREEAKDERGQSHEGLKRQVYFNGLVCIQLVPAGSWESLYPSVSCLVGNSLRRPSSVRQLFDAADRLDHSDGHQLN